MEKLDKIKNIYELQNTCNEKKVFQNLILASLTMVMLPE